MSASESYASSIRLAVRIRDGQVVLADGTPIPALHKDALAELIVDAFSLANDEDRRRLTREAAHEILPRGTLLWARVKLDEIPSALRVFRESKKALNHSAHDFVQFVAEEPIRLIASEGNLPVLAECKCRIPALPHVGCSSVNEAYTRISEQFEPSRRSHTGNVFACVFVEDAGLLRPLSKLRRLPVAAPASQASMFPGT